MILKNGYGTYVVFHLMTGYVPNTFLVRHLFPQPHVKQYMPRFLIPVNLVLLEVITDTDAVAASAAAVFAAASAAAAAFAAASGFTTVFTVVSREAAAEAAAPGAAASMLISF